MATLVHEIWVEYDTCGRRLPGMCHAGPGGEDFRRLLGPTARLARTFEAGSHFEAMRVYHRLNGLGRYKTEHAADHEPYPEEWARQQRR